MTSPSGIAHSQCDGLFHQGVCSFCEVRDWPGAHRWLNEHQRKSVKASSKHRRFLCQMNLTFYMLRLTFCSITQETSDSAAPPRSCTAWSNSSAALEPMRRRRSCEVKGLNMPALADEVSQAPREQLMMPVAPLDLAHRASDLTELGGCFRICGWKVGPM